MSQEVPTATQNSQPAVPSAGQPREGNGIVALQGKRAIEVGFPIVEIMSNPRSSRIRLPIAFQST